jgi:Flp pilus assembly protein TadD
MSSYAVFVGRLGAVATLGLLLSGCLADKMTTGSIMPTAASREVSTDASPEAREARWRELAAKYAPAYEKNPNDAATAYAYGVTLRALGQRAQALAVLEAASVKNPKQTQILAAYGRALSDVGRYEDALRVFERAHTPDRPDWRILNAQGAALDQLGRSDEARGFYEAALKVAPGEPAILSNLGLSYALSKDLAKAEATLAQAAASPKATDMVRANLAMVRSLRAGDPTPKKPAKPRA